MTVIKHADDEGGGTLLRGAGGYPVSEVTASRLSAADWLEIERAPVVVFMGGAMGVYEAARYPYLSRELELIKKRLSVGAPTLGICLGAQLLAEAAGSRVFSAGRREVGWFKVEPTSEGLLDPVIGAIDWSAPVFHWHGDTFELPRRASLLLRSTRFAQQAFKVGNSAYGVQFHPEITAAELPAWISSAPDYAYGKEDGIQSETEILEGGARFGTSLEERSERLMQGFLRAVAAI